MYQFYQECIIQHLQMHIGWKYWYQKDPKCLFLHKKTESFYFESFHRFEITVRFQFSMILHIFLCEMNFAVHQKFHSKIFLSRVSSKFFSYSEEKQN